MCFRPGGAQTAMECPVCGKKVQLIGGVLMKKCPFCKTDFSEQIAALEAAEAGGAPGAPGAPAAPGAPKAPGAPAAPAAPRAPMAPPAPPKIN